MALLLLAGCAPVAPPPPISQPAVATPALPMATAQPASPTPILPTAVPTATVAPTSTFVPTVTPRPSLTTAIQAALSRHPAAGTIGVVVTHLATGETFSSNADTRFRSASLYKLFVLDAALTAQANGRLADDEILTVSPALESYDPYLDWDVGTRVSVGCAIQTMIEMSGNAAADLLVQRLGLPAIDARIDALGLSQSALTDDTAFTSPADVARILESIARGQFVSPAASQRALDLLSAQQHNDRIPAPLPLSVRIAHKTGELPGVRHDAAIVFAPSGPYILVTMVQGAPTEAEARAAIVDLSRAAYASLEPSGLLSYVGMPPRLARHVLAVPDSQGRLALLGDPRTETAALPPEVTVAAEAQSRPRLRPEVVPDLVALQHAASDAGALFWVRAGFRQPTDAEASKTMPTEWIVPCMVEQPALVADRPVSSADVAAAEARQAWLGTVVTVSDQSDGQWLAGHAAEYGFVPALAESPGGRAMGHEPGAWRWVGREMAARLRPFVGTTDYSARALEVLQRAQADLAAMDPAASKPPLWGLTDTCWTVATSSGRGCPSRWYFLPIPFT
jgi:beta-lactamase class A